LVNRTLALIGLSSQQNDKVEHAHNARLLALPAPAAPKSLQEIVQYLQDSPPCQINTATQLQMASSEKDKKKKEDNKRKAASFAHTAKKVRDTAPPEEDTDPVAVAAQVAASAAAYAAYPAGDETDEGDLQHDQARDEQGQGQDCNDGSDAALQDMPSSVDYWGGPPGACLLPDFLPEEALPQCRRKGKHSYTILADINGARIEVLLKQAAFRVSVSWIGLGVVFLIVDC
jgi:hypothetical protein